MSSAARAASLGTGAWPQAARRHLQPALRALVLPLPLTIFPILMRIGPSSPIEAAEVDELLKLAASKVNVQVADSTYLPADAALKNLEKAGDNLLLVVATEHRR
jgi:hypothetical protein